jgi:hypothetical protein
MPLKDANVKVTGPAKENGKDEMPVITVPAAKGKHFVQIYNEAHADKKKAEQSMKETRPKLETPGVDEVFAQNCAHPLEPITSVKLTDGSGAVCRLSFTAKYGAADAEQVEAVFDATGKDINDYLVSTVAAKFDSKVFLDAEGNFSKTVYDKFRLAVERVAKELGVECPLSTAKVVIPKPDFHERRWKDFTVQQQKDISAVLPNVVTLSPVTA